MTVRQEQRARPAVPLNERLFRLDEASGRPVLRGSRCPQCRHSFFPTRTLCAACGRGDLEAVEFGPRGRVWTYTIARQAPPGAIVEAPYVVAQVELPEHVMVGTLVKDCDPESVVVGTEVEIVPVVVRQDEEGRDMVAFAFRPVQEAKR